MGNGSISGGSPGMILFITEPDPGETCKLQGSRVKGQGSRLKVQGSSRDEGFSNIVHQTCAWSSWKEERPSQGRKPSTNT